MEAQSSHRFISAVDILKAIDKIGKHLIIGKILQYINYARISTHEETIVAITVIATNSCLENILDNRGGNVHRLGHDNQTCTMLIGCWQLVVNVISSQTCNIREIEKSYIFPASSSHSLQVSNVHRSREDDIFIIHVLIKIRSSKKISKSSSLSRNNFLNSVVVIHTTSNIVISSTPCHDIKTSHSTTNYKQ